MDVAATVRRSCCCTGGPTRIASGGATSRARTRGFRTIAPDQRGMGGSYAPRGGREYTLRRWWATWWRASWTRSRRARVTSWATTAWPVGRVGSRVLRARPRRPSRRAVRRASDRFRAGIEQRQKSWYMLLFQFVGIAEEWISANDFRNFREWANHPDADAVVADLSRPGALHRRTQLVSRQRRPRVAAQAAARDAPNRRADDGRVEHRRPGSHRGADARLGRLRHRPGGATNASKGRATDATRGDGRAQRTPGRLPHRVKPGRLARHVAAVSRERGEGAQHEGAILIKVH